MPSLLQSTPRQTGKPRRAAGAIPPLRVGLGGWGGAGCRGHSDRQHQSQAPGKNGEGRGYSKYTGGRTGNKGYFGKVGIFPCRKAEVGVPDHKALEGLKARFVSNRNKP
ncbi:unnamed protein product [Phaeothamnion confervicola]